MKFDDLELTLHDFKGIVTGLKNDYNCWNYSMPVSKKHLSDGKNLICLASILLNESGMIRNYIYIKFHETLEEFFNVDLPRYDINQFFFIPISQNDLSNVDEIINDITTKHQINN